MVFTLAHPHGTSALQMYEGQSIERQGLTSRACFWLKSRPFCLSSSAILALTGRGVSRIPVSSKGGGVRKSAGLYGMVTGYESKKKRVQSGGNEIEVVYVVGATDQNQGEVL